MAAYAAALTLAPRLGGDEVLWLHWPFAFGWSLLAWLTDLRLRRQGVQTAPFWPPAAALVGLGLLALYRLHPFLGLRQTLWALVGLALFHLLLRPASLLSSLRRRRGFWMGFSLLLTALTLAIGHSPTVAGPRLWLGCCGVYFQPSETLKLALLVYLAGQFADEGSFANVGAKPGRKPWAAFLGPLLAVTLPLAQGDLGTALVLVMLGVSLLYLARGWPWLPGAALVGLVAAGVAGALFLPLVRLRVLAWLHPWADPLGYGYQPIQAALALARGGLLGRGPGLGTPYRVPLAHSDFIFIALVEELGLLGGTALLLLLVSLWLNALQVAAQRQDLFGRLLAAGLGVHYGGQSLIILGGNLRLLPVTGLPLPFLAYGGSALVVSFVGLALLLRLAPEAQPGAWQAWPRSLRRLAQGLGLGFLVVAVALILAVG
ncbi:MAG TPA: FtsW/RodA/SpoVE family cell cycle protein [Anaerolineae bacterium]|nr:FtsW/RodA/SpoVE family cell cycle protein [Anaerolineae bacterium]